MEQILVFSTESLRANPKDTLTKVFRFIGVDEAFACEKFEQKLNVTSRKRVKNKLGRAVAAVPVVDKLCKLAPKLGIPFSPNSHWPWPFSDPVKKPQLSSDLRKRLVDEISPDIEKFRDLTGQSFSEWSI
jgi:hypothetical protein